MSKEWSIVEPKEFFATKNEYNINGKTYFRVTRTLSIISKPGLLVWWQSVGKKRADEIVSERQIIGTKTHKLIELTLKDENIHLDTYEKEIRDAIDMFKNFRVDAKLKPESLEQHLWSNKYEYAGTADYIGKYTSNEKYLIRGHSPKFIKESRVIMDWKTSKSIYPEYELQLSAYAMAFKELTGLTLDGGAIVQIRFGRVKVKEYTWEELESIFPIYLATITLFNWKYKGKKT